MTRRFHVPAKFSALASAAAVCLMALAAIAIGADGPADSKAKGKSKLGYKDTPMLPGGLWHVHDGDRPQPPIVTPGTSSVQEKAGTAPFDAVVLFDGKSLAEWRDKDGGPAKWVIKEGAIESVPGSGYIYSARGFGDVQLHLEWATPTPAKIRR